MTVVAADETPDCRFFFGGFMVTQPIAVFYEHPEWFKPLFAELERRGVPVQPILADTHVFDPAVRESYSLVFNRMSPSAWLRGHAHSIFYTLSYLNHLEANGVPVVNGSAAYRLEISKAAQLDLLHQLMLPCPRSRVINHASQALSAAAGFRYPIIIKPNIGGSGAGVQKFDDEASLQAASDAGTIQLGIDHTALVQEFIPQESSRIVRVETLNGKYLYGIRIYTTGNSFDLCPADVCQTVDGQALNASTCAVDAPQRGLRVEAYTPPAEMISSVEQIVRAAKIDVGGVEYMIDERDGQLYYYDINALSNFVADAPNVIGFDPFVPLVDYLLERARALTITPAKTIAPMIHA
jgi:hypothetical protein